MTRTIAFRIFESFIGLILLLALITSIIRKHSRNTCIYSKFFGQSFSLLYPKVISEVLFISSTKSLVIHNCGISHRICILKLSFSVLIVIPFFAKLIRIVFMQIPAFGLKIPSGSWYFSVIFHYKEIQLIIECRFFMTQSFGILVQSLLPGTYPLLKTKIGSTFPCYISL